METDPRSMHKFNQQHRTADKGQTSKHSCSLKVYARAPQAAVDRESILRSQLRRSIFLATTMVFFWLATRCWKTTIVDLALIHLFLRAPHGITLCALSRSAKGHRPIEMLYYPPVTAAQP